MAVESQLEMTAEDRSSWTNVSFIGVSRTTETHGVFQESLHHDRRLKTLSWKRTHAPIHTPTYTRTPPSSVNVLHSPRELHNQQPREQTATMSASFEKGSFSFEKPRCQLRQGSWSAHRRRPGWAGPRVAGSWRRRRRGHRIPDRANLRPRAEPSRRALTLLSPLPLLSGGPAVQPHTVCSTIRFYKDPLCEFPRAAVTNYHKLSGLRQQTFILL